MGRRYPNERTVVFTPNMETLPSCSLLGVQNIRLRLGMHYGEHDPCFTPQPFNFSLAPHLALIPYPGSLDNLIYWVSPTEEEFELIAGHKLSPLPLGRIDANLVTLLEKEFFDMVANPASKLSKDHPKGKEYATRIRLLLARLRAVATFQQALMTWRLAQRNCLELHAHITWLTEVQPTFTREHAWKTHDIRSVVGAITDKRDVLEFCFRVGSPFSFTILCSPTLVLLGWYTDLVLPSL